MARTWTSPTRKAARRARSWVGRRMRRSERWRKSRAELLAPEEDQLLGEEHAPPWGLVVGLDLHGIVGGRLGPVVEADPLGLRLGEVAFEDVVEHAGLAGAGVQVA